MYLIPISFGGALTAVHGGAIARKASAGHKRAFGHWSDPTPRSYSLIDRLMSGMACLALPVLRRPMIGGPWRIELDCPHSPADPSAGSLYRTSRICRTFPRLFPLSTSCCYRLFCRSHGPTAGTVHAVAIGSQAGGFRCPTELCRRTAPATRVDGLPLRYRPPCTRCRRQKARLTGRDRCTRICRGPGLPGSPVGKGHRTRGSRQAGARMPKTMTVRRSVIATCGSGMESTSIGIFYFGAGLLAKSDQAALEARATTDG